MQYNKAPRQHSIQHMLHVGGRGVSERRVWVAGGGAKCLFAAGLAVIAGGTRVRVARVKVQRGARTRCAIWEV